MSEDNDKPTLKFKVLDKEPEEIIEKEETILSEEFNLDEDPSIPQLRFYRNLKLYINKMIGPQWLLLYRREEDGTPIYVPNENLSIEDQVFLAELAKVVAFNMISMEGREDN